MEKTKKMKIEMPAAVDYNEKRALDEKDCVVLPAYNNKSKDKDKEEEVK